MLNERQRLEREHKRLNPSAIAKGAKFIATTAVATTTILTLATNYEKLVKLGKKYIAVN